MATLPDLSTLGRFPASKRKMGICIMVPISEKSAFGGTPRFSDMLAITQKAEELGFDGVITTDCMEMDAIAKRIGTATTRSYAR